MAMVFYDMVTIPEPEPGTRTVLRWDPTIEGPLMRGVGPFSFRCGTCQRVLIETMGFDQIQSIVFVCPSCGNYNEPPPFTQHA